MRTLSDNDAKWLGDESRQFSVMQSKLRDVIREIVERDWQAYATRDVDSRILASFPTTIGIRWKAGFGAECSVDVHIDTEHGSYRRKEYRLMTVRAVITWASSNYSVSQAVAAMTLAEKAVQAAAVLESMFPYTYWSRADED